MSAVGQQSSMVDGFLCMLSMTEMSGAAIEGSSPVWALGFLLAYIQPMTGSTGCV